MPRLVPEPVPEEPEVPDDDDPPAPELELPVPVVPPVEPEEDPEPIDPLPEVADVPLPEVPDDPEPGSELPRVPSFMQPVTAKDAAEAASVSASSFFRCEFICVWWEVLVLNGHHRAGFNFGQHDCSLIVMLICPQCRGESPQR